MTLTIFILNNCINIFIIVNDTVVKNYYASRIWKRGKTEKPEKILKINQFYNIIVMSSTEIRELLKLSEHDRILGNRVGRKEDLA